MELNFKKLGKRIKETRLKCNFTQEQLAEQIGLSSVYISHIECGTGKTSLETLIKICNALSVTPDSLLLDSVYSSKEYLKEEIASMLKNCPAEKMRIVNSVIRAIIEAD